MTTRHLLALPFVLLCLLLFAAPGCSSSPIGVSPDGTGTGTQGICLLNNCTDDSDCGNCSDTKTTCYAAEKRCVACGPNAGGKTCKAGQYCTQYGNCSSNSTKCAEDGSGAPTISCNNTADCGACGPKFQVCDTTAHKCVGCSATNTTNCQSTDVCTTAGTCVAKCPATCRQDAECGQCGATGKEAHACNLHICTQCSATMACPNGGKCDLTHGTCSAPCGITSGKSDCETNDNCSGCKGVTSCKVPVNGGTGACAAPANGCSDIGKGIIVLPDPYSRVTQACSNDADCSGVSVDFNLGKELRDITGLSLIKDGNFPYSMHACASVEVLDKSCGLCVPCKQDADCTDVDITRVAGNIFGTIGSVASKLLLDKAFGPNDHKIHMYCQSVAGDYGACLPCSNPLARCAQTDAAVPATGTCDHEICDVGGPLGQQCDPCVASVCAKDPWCCTNQWDLQCKTDVDLYCAKKTCEPDKCVYRTGGWYCHADNMSAYHCAANPEGEEQIDDGVSCPDGYVCKPTGDGQKDPATLCTAADSDTSTQCTATTVGKAKCFKK